MLHGLSLRSFWLQGKVVTLIRLKSRDWIHQRVIDRIFFLFFLPKSESFLKQLFTKLDEKKRNHFYDFTFDVVVDVGVVAGVAVVGCIVVDVVVVIVQR